MLILSCRMSKEKQLEIFSRVIVKAQEGDYKAAIEILEKNIRKPDRGYLYYYYLGYLTQSQDILKYTPLALECFNIAYKIDPNTYDINSAIGLSYVGIKEYDSAIPYLEKAYELYSPASEAPPPYWALAEAYLHTGRIEEAIKINTKAIEESEFSWQYMQRGIILSQSGDVQALTENYNIAKKIEPNNLMLDRDYALRLVEIGYTEKAYKLYSDWLIGNENYYDWCYADMGFIYMLDNDWRRGYDVLKKAESISHTSVLTSQYLSFYYFFMKEYDRAYSYEASSRLHNEPSGITYWKKSTDEFIKGYENNWQFQKLLRQMEAKD